MKDLKDGYLFLEDPILLQPLIRLVKTKVAKL